MSLPFNHAIRHQWLEQGKNPILLVRQCAKRQTIPPGAVATELPGSMTPDTRGSDCCYSARLPEDGRRILFNRSA